MSVSLSAIYDHTEVEKKWYDYWLKNRFFRSVPDARKAYTIVMPPPNVTGVLHMGHMLNNTIQDVLIRRARTLGFNACLVPGTDHASIATEAKVVGKLRAEGILKSSLTRDEFLGHAWEWTHKHGGIILDQLKKLGFSCDWDRTTFTLDDHYYKAVVRVFVDLYRKGYVYRGLRMINWDCEAKTALSSEEVLYEEAGEAATLYHIKYALKDDASRFVVVATQRPETIMGDTAVAVNPNDPRYKDLVGKMVVVPFINRSIPVIADVAVEQDFGTGCLKVTPAHAVVDYEIGLKHGLEVIDTLNDDGTLNEKCELPEYVGKDRFVVRDLIIERLRLHGLVVEEEAFISKIGRSERTKTVVEPKLSMQWFIKMKEISRRAAEAVSKDDVLLFPSKFKNTYSYWMDNVRDWCISRQLYWGQRIPAWYLPDGDFVVAENESEALILAQKKNPELTLQQLRQDEDTLDTWASSWLWPLEVFKGFDAYNSESGKIALPHAHELAYYYPTEVIVTAPEILFFWIARMLIAGYEYTDLRPFKHVYLTGIVRDKHGRKMSKQLGNSPDPLHLIDRYSADGVRVGMLFSSPAGNDLCFDEALCEQGRNFANKLWNVYRFLAQQKVSDTKPFSDVSALSLAWFEQYLDSVIVQLNDLFDKYRLSEALLLLYNVVRDDFSAWLLEAVKPIAGDEMDAQTYSKLLALFHKQLILLHPFMPFITEEIWHSLYADVDGRTLGNEAYPLVSGVDVGLLADFEVAKEIVTAIRKLRVAKQVGFKESLVLYVQSQAEQAALPFADVIAKLANVTFVMVEVPVIDADAFRTSRGVYYMQFGAELVDTEAECVALEKELAHALAFLKSVEAKLGNEKFVANASADVVDREKSKQRDFMLKVAQLQQRILALKGR